MKKYIITLLSCIFIYTVCIPVIFAHAQFKLTKKEFKEIKDGKIILKETHPHYLKKYSNTPWVAVTFFERTPIEIAGVILDFHKYTKMFAKVKDLTVKPMGQSRYRLIYTVKSGFFTFYYTIIMTYDKKQNLIWWDLDPKEKNDFKTYKGYWKFIQRDKGTVAIYSISPIAKIAVPDFLQENGSRNEMPKTVQEIKDWIKNKGQEKTSHPSIQLETPFEKDSTSNW
ncbi:MAG: hypothetical protein P9M13_09430 [Candidatus Ancaeobacter aquaticus]|nr:hypothetical protein [Candidatus Ancaeobacter aquaticus]